MAHIDLATAAYYAVVYGLLALLLILPAWLLERRKPKPPAKYNPPTPRRTDIWE